MSPPPGYVKTIAQLVKTAVQTATNNNSLIQATKPKSKRKRQSRSMPTTLTGKSMPDSSRSQSMPIAVVPRKIRYGGFGLEDIYNTEISWFAGNILAGNGTLGAGTICYFASAALPTQVQLGPIPIAPADGYLGATYTQDIFKHYATKVYKRIVVEIISLQTDTSVSGEIVIAPLRGGSNAQFCVSTVGATANPNTTAGLLSMSGAVSLAPWQSRTIDYTPFIQGGSGAKQNEFVGVNIDTISTTFVNTGTDGLGVVPLCLVAAGTVPASLNGNVIHRVVIRALCDLRDFNGAYVNPAPMLQLPMLPSDYPKTPIHEHDLTPDSPDIVKIDPNDSDLIEYLKSRKQQIKSKL